MEVIAFSLIPSLSTITNLLTVVIGLGLVIFFHELGHFAVAKWCGVHVERFSIGFGKILWSFKRGETEYALSMVPFGGYVKMLGQDDADPSKMTDEEVTSNPRSYPAKSVPQRMAIISAGVIMNLITGMMFFAIAFKLGVNVNDRVVQSTQAGMPAWEYGIRPGDKITRINGNSVEHYRDIQINTALSTGKLTIEGMRPDGETFRVSLSPDRSGRIRRIGVLPADSLMVAYSPTEEGVPIAAPGSVVDELENGFQPGDTILAVDGVEVETSTEMLDYLARHRDQPVEFTVQSMPKEEGTQSQTRTITVPPAPFRELGITFQNGRITAIQRECPAATPDAEGDRIKEGDRIVRVNDSQVGPDLDPFELPDHFGKLAGEEVTVTVAREQGGGEPREVVITLIPEDRPGWTEQPLADESPLSIPSIGVAYQVLPTVFAVDEGGPAAAAGIKPRETITEITLNPPADIPESDFVLPKRTIKIGENGMPLAFWLIQSWPKWEVSLTVKSADTNNARTVTIEPRAANGWYLPNARGLNLNPSMVELKADTLMGAMAMGLDYTGDSVIQIYLTLRSLFTGDLSILNLSGPIGIAKIAWATASYRFADFLLFLGLISVNLAVINFLPIPVLDGGHMVFLIWEGITRRKPSEAVFRWATNLGLLFVMGLLVLVIYLDVFVSKL